MVRPSGKSPCGKNPNALLRNKCVSSTAVKYVCKQFTTPQHNIFTNCLQPVRNALLVHIFTEYMNLGSVCRTALLIFSTEVAAYRIKSLSETRHFYGVEQIEYTL